jgi:hypothetical protein
MFTYFFAYLSINLYILLRPSSCNFYTHIRSIHVYIHLRHLRPIHVHIHLRPYTLHTCLHTSKPIYHICMPIYVSLHISIPMYLYKFTYFYAHISTLVYILLLTYTSCTCLHTSKPIYAYIYMLIYMLIYFYAHIPLSVYIILRISSYINLYTSMPYFYTFLHTSTPIYLYTFTYFYANMPMHVYILLNALWFLHTSTPI